MYGSSRVDVHGVQLWIFVMNQQFFELSKKWKENKEVDKKINRGALSNEDVRVLYRLLTYPNQHYAICHEKPK